MATEVYCRVANCVYWNTNKCTAREITIAVEGAPTNASAINDRQTECETFKKRD